MSTRIVFIDTRITDYATLIAGLQAGTEVYLIDPQANGLEQIAAHLHGRTGIDALHIFSHGSSGQVSLGSTSLNISNLAEHQAALAHIGSNLSEAGDILLYGCEVAANANGADFIGRLAQLTGADVAASDDLTGAAALGGDWVLEVASGPVEASTISAGSYEHLLVETGRYIQGDGSGGGGGGSNSDQTTLAASPKGGDGGGGDDTLNGTAGNDVIFGDGSGGGGGGRPAITGAPGGAGGKGGGGADVLNGGAGNDVIFGDGFDGASGDWSAAGYGNGGLGGGGGGGGGYNLDNPTGGVAGLGAGSGSGWDAVRLPLLAEFGNQASIKTNGADSVTDAEGHTGTGGAAAGGAYGGGGGFGGAAGGAGGVNGANGDTAVHEYLDTGAIHGYFTVEVLRAVLTKFPNYGAGNDTIDGGSGSDELFGLGGADTFIFDLATAGINDRDRVWDFSISGADKLQLKNGAVLDAEALKILLSNASLVDADGDGAVDDLRLAMSDTGKALNIDLINVAGVKLSGTDLLLGPSITSASYDFTTGVLVVTGTNLEANSSGLDIDASAFRIVGGNDADYQLTDTPDVEISSPTSFSLTLSAADKTEVNALLNKNGSTSTDDTTYNIAATTNNWNTNVFSSRDITGNGITVSNWATPTITSATFDASSGVLVVTGSLIEAKDGANNDIAVNKLTLTGEGDVTYTLTSSDVEITSATEFSITLNTTDQAALNQIFNQNGTASTSGTTFNLAAADDWNTNVTTGDTADATNAVTVSNVAVPTITSATYDYASNTLVVTGTGFLKKSGDTNDIDISKLAFTGEGGATYTLTSAADVEITSGTQFTVTLSGADLSQIEALLSANGTSAASTTLYNLAAAEDWAAGANAAVDVADPTGNGITVSNWAAPAITSAAYDWTTAQLVLTGTDFVNASGPNNDIVANLLTLSGEGGSYTLTDSANVEITSATSASVILSATDQLNIHGLLNKNGLTSGGNVTYNLAAADNWMAGSPAASDIADATGNGVTVSNVRTPNISTATYDHETGVLVVTGANLFKKVGADNDVDVQKLTFTGQGGGSYTIDGATADVEITSATSFTLTLTGADKTGVDALLNQIGDKAADNTTYNLAAGEDWLAGADAGATIADSSCSITVSAAPRITSATYDATSKTLVVSGSNFPANDGLANDIDVSKLVITGEGGATFTLSGTGVEITNTTSFTVTLNDSAMLGFEMLMNKVGNQSAGGTAYNLAANTGWAPGYASTPADLTGNPITVSNVPAPTITSASYDASTGVLSVSGSGFLRYLANNDNNDIDVSKLSLIGEGGESRTLTSGNVDIQSGTSFRITLNAADQAALALFLNKIGTESTGGTSYNLAAAEDWAAGADAGVVTADLTGNGIIVSNVALPTITSATYNATTGVLVVTGTGFVKRDGAVNDIVANKFTLAGGADATHTLTDTANVEITSATSFTLTLSADDKTAVNALINKTGATSVSGTTYNLAAAEDWAAGADAAVNVADQTGNTITATVNAAPTITGVPGSALAVTTGQAAALADFTVSDPDGADVALTVTLTASNGNIGGVTDADTSTPGIQLTGTAAQINTALAAATFTASVAGAASVGISVSDDIAAPVTATYSLSASNPPVPPPPPPEPDEDGVPSEVEDAVPGLPSPDGTIVAGDGNGDGIPDSQQSSVTSLPFRNTDTVTENPQAPVVFVTLVAGSEEGTPDGEGTITSVRQLDAPPDGPADLNLPLGLISFTATTTNPGAPKWFSLFVPSDLEINGYWKPTATGWVNLASPEFGGQIVTVGDKTRLDFVIEDNGPFDTNPTPGIIGDPGGPGFMQVDVPLPSSDCPYDPFKPDADGDGMPDAIDANPALKDNDVFTDHTLFAQQIYRDLLGREGDTQGVNHWAAALADGQTRADLVAAFIDGAEFDLNGGAIARLYHATLGRSPDFCGFNYWLTQSLNGLSAEQMGDAFLQSPEFVGSNPDLTNEEFVDLLYLNVLGREADPDGKAYWLDQMEQGMSRGSVLYEFAQSDEYKAALEDEVAIDMLYLGLLDRAPDQGGWDYWHGQYAQYDSTADFYDAAMEQPEYHDRFLPAESEPVSLTGVTAEPNTGL